MAKTVLAHGCFDLVHAGHIEHLRKAAALGDRLVVSVTSDRYVNKGPGRPLFPERERMVVIAALRFVDNVILSDTGNAVSQIMMVRPALYVKGPDYLDGDKTGNLALEKSAIESIGGRLVIVNNEIVYSSTEIISGALLAKRIAQCEAGQ